MRVSLCGFLRRFSRVLKPLKLKVKEVKPIPKDLYEQSKEASYAYKKWRKYNEKD